MRIISVIMFKNICIGCDTNDGFLWSALNTVNNFYVSSHAFIVKVYHDSQLRFLYGYSLYDHDQANIFMHSFLPILHLRLCLLLPSDNLIVKA